jgi:hypothetical protein
VLTYFVNNRKLRDAFLSALRLQVTMECKKLWDDVIDGYGLSTDVMPYVTSNQKQERSGEFYSCVSSKRVPYVCVGVIMAVESRRWGELLCQSSLSNFLEDVDRLE